MKKGLIGLGILVALAAIFAMALPSGKGMTPWKGRQVLSQALSTYAEGKGPEDADAMMTMNSGSMRGTPAFSTPAP